MGGKRKVAGLVVAALLATMGQPDAGASTPFVERFDAWTWWSRWGLPENPWHTYRESNLLDGNFLRVHFPSGSRNGTSFHFATGSAETVRLRYRIRFAPNWQPMASESGKIPGFGRPAWTTQPDTCIYQCAPCAAACGGSPANASHYSARTSFQGALNGIGSYYYTPCASIDPAEPLYQDRDPWGSTRMENGVWYSVDLTITMNTPGEPDGSLRASVNGTEVYHGTDLCFRDEPGVPVGGVWMDFYYGGENYPPPTVNTHIDIDDVQIDY